MTTIEGECTVISVERMDPHKAREYELLRAEEVRRGAPGCRQDPRPTRDYFRANDLHNAYQQRQRAAWQQAFRNSMRQTQTRTNSSPGFFFNLFGGL